MSDMRMYNILGIFKGLNDNAKESTQLNESVKQPTVYENVEPQGSIMEAVKSLGEKYMGFKAVEKAAKEGGAKDPAAVAASVGRKKYGKKKFQKAAAAGKKLGEAAKPDFLDVDKDGDKAEPFKKAVKDKKEVDEGTIAKPKKDLRKHSATAKRMAMQKKADKGHEEWLDHLEKTDPDHPSLKYRKQATNEGAGPYTLDDPKHPKFKANYEKYKKAHPDCTLAEFVAAMRKKEKGLAEAAYDEPAAPDAEAIAKRKRLQAIKDRQEEQGDIYGKEKNTPIRKVAGKAYGGAAQKDDAEKDDLDEVVRVQHPYGKGQEFTSKWERDEAAFQAKRQRDINRNTGVYKSGAKERKGALSGTNTTGGGSTTKSTAYNDEFSKKWVARDAAQGKPVAEVAPPGAKAERMVKHIKKGYAKDGALTKKEKGIAYATAWKAHNKGHVEEGVSFSDIVKNSKAELKKAKPAMVKESRVMEETDYFYEKVAKALCQKNTMLDTASGDFVTAVRKEMVAQGIQPNRARNILLMDEDFLMDVASSYGHYCKEIAECGAPMNSFLGGAEELDEIAKLAGLTQENTMGAVAGGVAGAALGKSPAAARVGAAIGDQLTDESIDDDERKLERYHELIKQGMDPDDAEVEVFNDEGDEELDEREQFQSMPKGYASGTPKAPAPMREEEMEEGNEFSGALAKAKATGAKDFEVDGKKYTVKEDVNINVSANGEFDSINLIRQLAGLNTYANILGAKQASDSSPGNTDSQEVAEERDIEHTNTPNEKIAGVEAAIPSGNDMHRAKKSYSDKPYQGDNPMAVKEEALWKSYEAMIQDVKK